MKEDNLHKDYMRYGQKKKEMPKFQKYYRKTQNANNIILKLFFNYP